MRSNAELNPFKSITQDDVDRLYGQICKIPLEYKKTRSFLKKLVSNQSKADELVVLATEIYNTEGNRQAQASTPAIGSNPDLWQHKEKQRLKAAAKHETANDAATEKHVLISHTKNTMFDVRPVKSIEELKEEIEKLKLLKGRTNVQNRKLEILERQYKISLSENRIVSESEIDHYAELADKYARLLSLLNREFEEARTKHGKTVAKETKDIVGRAVKTKVHQPMEVSELIHYLNTHPDDDHLLRMMTAILKERFSDSNRHLLSGIAFYDNTGVYETSAFSRRSPFVELNVPDEYDLGLSRTLAPGNKQ
tara:strand:- start:3024 stop:3950 length:927 start_codon:yes stop_codon:yes gene_type:complete